MNFVTFIRNEIKMTSIRDKNRHFVTNLITNFWLIVIVLKVTMEEFTMNEFKLKAPYEPTGDQPQAIAELVKGSRKAINARLY